MSARKKTEIFRTGNETGKGHDHVKSLELTLHDQKFDGNDPIKVLKILTELTRECNTLQITEVQAHIPFPYLLKVTARETFVASRTLYVKDEWGINLLQESVQY